MKKMKLQPKYAFIFTLCLVMIAFEFVPQLKQLPFTSDVAYNRLLSLIIPLLAGVLAVYMIAAEFGLKLFKKPQHLWVLLPGMVIALDNFPWLAFTQGKMQLIHTNSWHFGLFFAYCILVGVFEEILFRGIFFAVLAEVFGRMRKFFFLVYLLSSVAFGAIHLLNVFTAGPAAFLQAGYSILTGGLVAFIFITTKTILFPALIHAVYNFCGLLFTQNPGLGAGSVIDLPTAIMMAVISLFVGVFVLYCGWKYPDDEREQLYNRLNLRKSE